LRFWPEFLLGAAACVILLGYLGSPELWGKREQRAAAEALDTVENHRWLVAEIQGRPRLEKPPLPRWTSAALMRLTGCRSEFLVRLPSALSGLATVALVYLLGLRIGGRPLALTSAMALCTTGTFISEHRQAGNDGMLGLFATLALYAAWSRLHRSRAFESCPDRSCFDSESLPGSRVWTVVFCVALGLGFLCKGPVILLLVGATIIPYLACTGRLKSHGKYLVDARGWLIFLGLSACWPVAVVIHDPNAPGVWVTEMGQKTGLLLIGHRQREVLGLMFPILASPWSVLALVGVFLPALARRRVRVSWSSGDVWFPWWWAIGNLAVFSVWAVAKPHYFVPCLPGLAILIGKAWLRLCAAAREGARATASRLASSLLGLQWLLLIAAGLLIPLISQWQFGTISWAVLVSVAGLLWCGAVLAAMIWHRGHDALAPLPIVAACACGVLVGYGLVAPLDDAVRGHSRLALQLDRLVPSSAATLRFFHEIDEGLWFYLRNHRLAPVPGSQPRYSDSYDQLGSVLDFRLDPASREQGPASPLEPRKQQLLQWLRREGPDHGFVLLKASLYDRLRSELNSMAVPVYREERLKRNELVLLRVLRNPEALTGFEARFGPASSPDRPRASSSRACSDR
jgi:4-amino-4-deoxy-L-arabinose transferase-like glycosyltransferase